MDDQKAGREMMQENKIRLHRMGTKAIHIGEKVIGGGNPILIQSMTNTPTENVKATVEQIHRLENNTLYSAYDGSGNSAWGD